MKTRKTVTVESTCSRFTHTDCTKNFKDPQKNFTVKGISKNTKHIQKKWKFLTTWSQEGTGEAVMLLPVRQQHEISHMWLPEKRPKFNFQLWPKLISSGFYHRSNILSLLHFIFTFFYLDRANRMQGLLSNDLKKKKKSQILPLTIFFFF